MGVLPIMAFKGGLRLKGVPFSGFKGKSVISVKGMQRCQCQIQTLVGGGGGPVIQTLKYGAGAVPPPKIFRPFGPQFGLKIRLGPGPSPGSATGSKLGMGKAYQLSIEGIRKGYLFCQKWYIKG